MVLVWGRVVPPGFPVWTRFRSEKAAAVLRGQSGKAACLPSKDRRLFDGPDREVGRNYAVYRRRHRFLTGQRAENDGDRNKGCRRDTAVDGCKGLREELL